MVVHGVAAPRGGALGWVFGSAWLAAGVWWLFISLHRYGGLPAAGGRWPCCALSLALSLYLALAMALFARWRSGAPVARRAAVRRCCGCWPNWRAPGCSPAFRGWPRLCADRLAAGGAGAMARRAAASVRAPRWPGRAGVAHALAARAARCGGAGGGAAALLACARARHVVQPPGATLTVSLLQSNVAQDEKFVAEQLPATLAWLARRRCAGARRTGGGARNGGPAAAVAAGRSGARLLARR